MILIFDFLVENFSWLTLLIGQ